MNRIRLRRLETPDATNPTLGHFVTDEEQLMCCTIELPWRNNETGKSCIPPTMIGTRRLHDPYHVHLRYSPSFKRNLFEIIVPNRSAILIHVANYISELRGCVATGRQFKDINADGVMDVESSKDALAAFMAVMGAEDFELDVIEPEPLPRAA